MTPRAQLPWAERLRRELQSLRDRASRLSRAEDALGPRCARCEGETLLGALPSEAGPLPHWIEHGITEVASGIRTELTWEMLDRPFGDATLGDAIRGIGAVPTSQWTEHEARGDLTVREHHRVVEMWLHDEARMLGPWLRRIAAAGARTPVGTPISARHLERIVFDAPDALWLEVCRDWGRRLSAMQGAPRLPAAARGSDLVTPRWLSSPERALVQHSIRCVIEQWGRARMQQLDVGLRRIDDPLERADETSIARHEVEQEKLELCDDLVEAIASHQDDVALGLALAAHDAAIGRRL